MQNGRARGGLGGYGPPSFFKISFVVAKKKNDNFFFLKKQTNTHTHTHIKERGKGVLTQRYTTTPLKSHGNF